MLQIRVIPLFRQVAPHCLHATPFNGQRRSRKSGVSHSIHETSGRTRNATLNPSGEVRLLLASAEPILNLGGVGMVVQRLILGLPSHYRVSLASPDADREHLPAALKARVVNASRIPPQKWSADDKAAFLDHIRQADYDLINFHGGTFSFDAHLPWRSPLYPISAARIPWINTNHCAPALAAGLFPENYPFYLKAPKFALALLSKTRLLAKCRREVMVSDENSRRIASWFPWAKRKLTTIYSARLEGEAPAPIFRDPVITIANLGHLAWRKGQADLLKAFCLLSDKFPQLQLLLAGPDLEPECASWIRTEVARTGLQNRVHLPGGLTDLREFWPKVDIYVQPSHYEGAPMALMEALWNSKPAVGTRVSGIPEIIDEEKTGLLVESKDPQALANALERLIRDPELRRHFGAAGPARISAKSMTGAQMVQRYADLYAEVLSRPSSRDRNAAT